MYINKNDFLIQFLSVFLNIGSNVECSRINQWKFSRPIMTQNLSRVFCHILNNLSRIWQRTASERANSCDVIWPPPTATCAIAAVTQGTRGSGKTFTRIAKTALKMKTSVSVKLEYIYIYIYIYIYVCVVYFFVTHITESTQTESIPENEVASVWT
jgi:hypothetical protein